MTDSKKNKAKTNGEVKDTPDLQQLWNEDELLKGLMETLAWSGDFDMGNSLLAAALGKETKELKASLKKAGMPVQWKKPKWASVTSCRNRYGNRYGNCRPSLKKRNG